MLPVRSFPPSASPDAVALILGSMPGEASLRAQQYYAHPRNGFWPILEKVLAIPKKLPYEERLLELRKKRIALWDVLASCVRPGSLDSDIRESTVVPNDFVSFFAEHLLVRTVFFNGAKAEQAWKKYVVPMSPALPDGFRCIRLPSTSPAHAGMSLHRKAEAWKFVRHEAVDSEKED